MGCSGSKSQTGTTENKPAEQENKPEETPAAETQQEGEQKPEGTEGGETQEEAKPAEGEA